MKKILVYLGVSVLILCILSSGISVYAMDDNQKFIDDANKLKLLGILKGTEQGLELDRSLSKAEAAVMLVRFMQSESKALQVGRQVVYDDVPQWAEPYIAYLCENGLISVDSPSEFGANDSITAEEFISSMLKLLGYDDLEPGEELDKAKEIGMISETELNSITADPVFNRMHASLIAYNTLKTCIKDNGKVFINKLIEEGSIGANRVTIIEDKGKVEDIIIYNPHSGINGNDSLPITVFLGDSHTESIFLADKFQGYRTLNKGLNGYTTRKILGRINEVVDEKPQKIFLMAGTNDIWEGVQTDTTVKNYSLMLDIIKDHVPDCKVYIQSTLPFGEAALKRNYMASNEKVESFNEQLKLLAEEYGAAYLDIASLYKDAEGNLDSRYSTDGIHIRLEYYVPWISVIKEIIMMQ